MSEFPVNFQFSVEFHNHDFEEDRQFQSVDGLYAELIPGEKKNSLVAQFDVLILKRAYRPDSKLVAWCMDAINNKVIQEETLTVKLLNSRFEPVGAWHIEKAIPQSWRISELNAEESNILIETITLKYDFFQVTNSKGKIVSPKPKPKTKRKTKPKRKPKPKL